ncbi:MAG: hypothetical protein R2873_26410 [Caldilineaceae bacterium]
MNLDAANLHTIFDITRGTIDGAAVTERYLRDMTGYHADADAFAAPLAQGNALALQRLRGGAGRR